MSRGIDCLLKGKDKYEPGTGEAQRQKNKDVLLQKDGVFWNNVIFFFEVQTENLLEKLVA